MSKVMAVGAAGIGATSVTVGGYYLFNGSEAGTSDKDGKTPDPNPTPNATDPAEGISTGSSSEPSGSGITSEPTASPSVPSQGFEFETVADFEPNMKKAKCVSDYFGEITNKPNAPDMSTNTPDTGSFFKTPSGDSYKSCLSINGKIASYSEDKWNGKFTWLWTFISGDEGFINFNIAESYDEESGQLKFSGVFYLVGKESNWEVKYQREASNKVVDKDNLESYFPKASNDLKDSVGGEYWGLFDDEEKLKKSCKTDDCGSDSPVQKNINKNLSFEKGTEQSKKLVGWDDSLDWWTNIYSNIGSWSLENKTDSFIGTWKVSE